MTARRLALGAAGEAQAAAWYEANGYEIVARNWRCRDGEIDLIVRRQRTIVFCEVKTRTSTAFGTPAEAITRAKREKLRHLAARWLDESPIRAMNIRFDVAAILAGELEMIEGAF
ncbi:MAG: YraN family protein [Acidimicrobiales bacterium]